MPNRITEFRLVRGVHVWCEFPVHIEVECVILIAFSFPHAKLHSDLFPLLSMSFFCFRTSV